MEEADIKGALVKLEKLSKPVEQTAISKELSRQVLNHCHGLLNGTNLGRHSLESDEVQWLLVALAALGEVFEEIGDDYEERLKQILIDRPDYSH